MMYPADTTWGDIQDDLDDYAAHGRPFPFGLTKEEVQAKPADELVFPPYNKKEVKDEAN